MQVCCHWLERFRGCTGIEYGHPRASGLRRAIRCLHGTEFSHCCPILSQIVPNSRSPVAEVSPNWTKIAIPVPYCPILSHPVFPPCFWSTYGQGLRPKTTSAPSLANVIYEHIYVIIIQRRRRGWQGRRLTRQGNRVLFVSTQNWSNVGGYGSGSGSASFGSGCEGRRWFGFPPPLPRG